MATVSEFRQLALSLENVVEQPHFEKVSYRVKKKIFATLDEKGGTAVIKLNHIAQSVFCAIDERMFQSVSGAWGNQGWTEIELSQVPKDLLLEGLRTAHQIATGTWTVNNT